MYILWCLSGSAGERQTAVTAYISSDQLWHTQTVVTAYFLDYQLLLLGFVL